MALEDILQQNKADLQLVHDFCDTIYNDMFKASFDEVRDLYKRMKSEVRPITDDELEYILTTFPLELINVAENLNKIRLDREVIKLRNAERVEQLRNRFTGDTIKFEGWTKSEKQTWVNHAITTEMLEYEILFTAYNSVVTRVENEQSFARELIMGAKKIWDSRRSSENVNPVSPTAAALPEYNRKQYVK